MSVKYRNDVKRCANVIEEEHCKIARKRTNQTNQMNQTQPQDKLMAQRKRRKKKKKKKEEEKTTPTTITRTSVDSKPK